MTAYSQTLDAASLRFLSPTALYPSEDLYPGEDVYPSDGTVLWAMARSLGGVTLTFHGAVASSSARTQLLTGVLHPVAAFTKRTSRSLVGGALAFAGSVVGVRAVHFYAKTLVAALTAAGSLHAIRTDLINPPGGGGFVTPMGESHFRRYRPTLRRQRRRG